MCKKKVICWGDSITIGMGMSRDSTYPAVLGSLLSDDFKVINAGSSGETAATIAARQGAVKVYTSKELVFPKGVSTIEIGTDNDHSMCLSDGTMLNINRDGESFTVCELPCNHLWIKDIKYNFSVSNGVFKLSRYDDGTEVVIPKGTEIVFSSAIEQAKGSYCEIFYIGTNGRVLGTPTEKDIQHLIQQNKDMIKRHGNDCYLVIVPYWDHYYSDAFVEAFGDKAVDFRKEVIKEDANYEGLVPSNLDLEVIRNGDVPVMFRYENNPQDGHLNKYGYSFLARILYERGKKLGYWV